MSKKNFVCPLRLAQCLISIIPHEWMHWYSGICIYTHAQHSGECVHIFRKFTISNSSAGNSAWFPCSFLLALQGCLHLKWLTPHNCFFSQYFSEVTNLRAKNQEPLRKTQFYYVNYNHNLWQWILSCVVQILPRVNRCHHHQEEHNAASWKGFSNLAWA